MWPFAYMRIVLIAGAVLCVSAVVWYFTAQHYKAVILQDQSDQARLVADYERQRADGEAKARTLIESEQAKGREADDAYQATLKHLNEAAVLRPARVVRVQCPPTGPVPAADPGQAGDPVEPPGAAANRSGVGHAAENGDRGLDVSTLDAVLDRAKQVSAELRGLQASCTL